MWNNTKQNMVASSDYECLIWGVGGRQNLGVGGRARTGRTYEGSTSELKAYGEGRKKPMNGAERLNAHSTWHIFLS